MLPLWMSSKVCTIFDPRLSNILTFLYMPPATNIFPLLWHISIQFVKSTRCKCRIKQEAETKYTISKQKINHFATSFALFWCKDIIFQELESNGSCLIHRLQLFNTEFILFFFEITIVKEFIDYSDSFLLVCLGFYCFVLHLAIRILLVLAGGQTRRVGDIGDVSAIQS